MKKTIITLLLSAIIASFMFGTTAAMAIEEPSSFIQSIFGKSGLSPFDRIHKLASVDPGAETITSIIFIVIDFLKYLFGAVAVIYLIISGIKLITATTKIDEVSEKEKENLKFIVYGLILIIIADELVTKVFFGEYGECLASASNAQECATAGSGLVKGIYSLVLAFIATAAVFTVVTAAFRLVTAYGDEEVIKKEKKRIAMAIVGLLISGLGEFIVKGIIFPGGGTKGINVAAAQKLVLNFTNFIAAFIGAGAFVMLFYAGYLYVSSFGNEEQMGKAKKIIIGAVIGIAIALAAYGLVATITSLTAIPAVLPK